MHIYFLLTIFAFLPFGAYLLSQKTKNKGLVLGFSFFYLLACLLIYTGNFYSSNPYQLKEVNKKIIQKISSDEPIEINLYNELTAFSEKNLSKNWIQPYLLNALSLKSFNSAESLISIAEDIYSEPKEKVIFYSMYTLLRDTRFPLYSEARLDVTSSHPTNCNQNSSMVRLDIVDGPGVPIAENSFSNTSEYSLSNKNSLIPGFDIASALLNNESIEIFIELNCKDNSEIYQFNSIFIFDPNSPLNTYKINLNDWSKRKQ
ncbi:hypothetical protein N9K08_04895 [Gammaproteobacteria bacterium]|nr:hypothetical protein [Gammaproteobacteria bacterium]